MQHPFLDFDFLPEWDLLTADRVEPDISRAIEMASTEIDRIAALPTTPPPTWNDSFGALERATEPLSRAWNLVAHLDAVRNAPDLRAALGVMLPRVSEFTASIPLNEKLYAVLSAAADATPDAEPVFRRHMDETLAEFREHGADLPADQKAHLKRLQTELAQKTQTFSEHVLDSTNAWEKVVTDETLIAGLPESARNVARESAKQKGHEDAWRFTLQIPSVMPALTFLDSDDLRHEIWAAFQAVASEGELDNEPLVWEILALRREIAAILGKENYADVVLERRMAKRGSTALAFVEGLHDRIADAFARENREIEQFAAEAQGSSDAGPLEPWQQAYWQEKLKKARYDFDDESIRPYFSLDRVLDGLFSIAGEVFGFTVTERTGSAKPSVWHPDVRFYDLHDATTGEHLGSFFADWHPRETKRAGAWMNLISTGERTATQREPHLGLMCGNLAPPTADAPSLLNHREVETIWHEFGHLIHHLLGDVPIKGLSGPQVAWDFVELPSQIMENWTWQKEALDRFAVHYQRGTAIPADLLERMLAARSFGAARATMRQLSFGKMDLELHVNYDRHKGRDLDALIEELMRGYWPPSATVPRSNVRMFNHLFSNPVGYAAGYYSYKWAEVLEADAFSRFLSEGIFNTATGRDFRDRILSRGNSDDPALLFRAFMGRDPDPEALLKRDGLAG